jgi:probable addiction module antidote protein
MARKTKARETFSRYDTADYLKTADDVAAYLEAVMEEAGDDGAFVAQALGTVGRARGMAQLARDTGLTREGLYKALAADGNPSFGTILKVFRALGLKLAPLRVGAPARSVKRRVA